MEQAGDYGTKVGLINTAASIFGWTSSYAVTDTANWKSGYCGWSTGIDGKRDENVAFIIVRPQKWTGDALNSEDQHQYVPGL